MIKFHTFVCLILLIAQALQWIPSQCLCHFQEKSLNPNVRGEPTNVFSPFFLNSNILSESDEIGVCARSDLKPPPGNHLHPVFAIPPFPHSLVLLFGIYLRTYCCMSVSRKEGGFEISLRSDFLAKLTLMVTNYYMLGPTDLSLILRDTALL